VAERSFIASLMAPLARNAAARGLADDAAVWTPPLGRQLVLSHDTMVAGVHFLADDPPGDVGWKLVAVNASDLAAMGARPAGALLSVALGQAQDAEWQAGFARGLGQALDAFGLELWGGDTVSGVASPVLGMTVVGHVEPGRALGRSGAQAGDRLWVSGTIGDAGLALGLGLGLAMAQGVRAASPALLKRLRRPVPRLALGAALVGVASACMDVSDGLLIDAERLAAASGVGLAIDLAAVPLSSAALAAGLEVIDAVVSGDDYELLFTAPEAATVPPGSTCIGTVVAGEGLRLTHNGHAVPLPFRKGWEHAL
jgi:thiamine-monophosphate kinase